MKIEDNFVPREIAYRLKDLNFDEECLCYIDADTDNIEFFEYYDCDRSNSTLQSEYGGNKFCTAPLYQQVLQWFREKYKIHIQFDWYGPDYKWGYTIDEIAETREECKYIKKSWIMNDGFYFYKEALESSILKTIWVLI